MCRACWDYADFCLTWSDKVFKSGYGKVVRLCNKVGEISKSSTIERLTQLLMHSNSPHYKKTFYWVAISLNMYDDPLLISVFEKCQPTFYKWRTEMEIPELGYSSEDSDSSEDTKDTKDTKDSIDDGGGMYKFLRKLRNHYHGQSITLDDLKGHAIAFYVSKGKYLNKV